MRVTTKGQVTIPQPVRERLGIVPGSEVEFVLDATGARLVRTDSGVGGEITQRMRGRATVPMTTREIMALTRSDD